MTATNSAIELYNQRSVLVIAAIKRYGYLDMRGISEVIEKSVSIARLLVLEMEAAGDLVIVTQGFRRYYYLQWPAQEQLPPKPKKILRETEEKQGIHWLRPGERNLKNTCADECRKNNGINLRVTTLLRQASLRAA